MKIELATGTGVGMDEGPKYLAGFVFRVGTRDEAVQLRAPIYEATLGSAGIDESDERATHLVAVDRDGRTRACLRVEDSRCRPFSVEAFASIQDVVESASSAAEISRFVVHPDVRAIRTDQFVHLGMLKLVYEYATKAKLTDLLTLSLPHLDRLYEMALFEKIEGGGIHPIWGPVQPMHMSLERARIRARQKPTKLSVLIFNSSVPNVVL